VRSDKTLSSTPFRRSDQWQTNPFTRERQTGIDRRYEQGRVESDNGTQWHSFSGHERNCFFRNQQGRAFRDESTLSGLDQVADSRAFVVWDFDHDGAADIGLVNANYPLLNLYRNQTRDASAVTSAAPTPAGRFVALRLHGGNTTAAPNRQLSARDAYGAAVRIEAGGLKLLREHRCGEGFAAQNSATLLVGLGAATRIERLSVRWPSGRTDEWTDLPVDRLIELHEVPDAQDDGQTLRVADYAPATRPTTNANSHPSTNTDDTNPPSLRPIGQLDLATCLPADLPRDRPLYLLTTMATWCEACLRHQPHLENLGTRYADQLVLCGVPVDPIETPEELARYAEKARPAYRILSHLDPEQRDRVMQVIRRELKTESIPCSLLVDSQGRILQAFYGTPDASDIGRWLIR